MKKFATLMLLLSMGLFTFGTVGCNGAADNEPEVEDTGMEGMGGMEETDGEAGVDVDVDTEPGAGEAAPAGDQG